MFAFLNPNFIAPRKGLPADLRKVLQLFQRQIAKPNEDSSLPKATRVMNNRDPARNELGVFLLLLSLTLDGADPLEAALEIAI